MRYPLAAARSRLKDLATQCAGAQTLVGLVARADTPNSVIADYAADPLQ
jgi:hypothetical protein